MWRDGTVYDPAHLTQQGAKGLRGSIRKLEASQAELERAKKKASARLRTRVRQARITLLRSFLRFERVDMSGQAWWWMSATLTLANGQGRGSPCR
jgi:hypothetical protein